MSTIKILDCTLRDGAHVNGGNFGFERIRNIIHSLNDSGVDIIEVGFLRNCEFDRNITNFNKIADINELKLAKLKSKLCLLVRAGTYDVTEIEEANEVVNFIRIAFRKDELESALITSTILKKKGYSYFFNPINVTSYSEGELKKVLSILNEYQPEGVAIVDTYGALSLPRFNNFLEIFEESLNSDIKLGIHLHENLSISNGIVQNYLNNSNINRETVIDASLFGMGRIPGNLPIELLITSLAKYSIGSYNLLPILNVIEEEIEKEKAINNWGYSQSYLISANFNIDRTYAENCAGFNIEKTYYILEKIKNSGHGYKYDKNILEKIISELNY
jgi:4-hydroxy 2-oxovalerate aldolase